MGLPEQLLYLGMMVLMVLSSFGLAALTSPKRYIGAKRSLVTGFYTTVMMHVYIVVFEEVDQLIAVSVTVGFLVGFGGGLLLESIVKVIKQKDRKT